MRYVHLETSRATFRYLFSLGTLCVIRTCPLIATLYTHFRHCFCGICVDETLDWNAMHNIDEDKDHDRRRFRSSSTGHAQGHAPERAEEWRTREQDLPSGQRMKDTNFGGKEDHFKGEERAHAFNELSTCGRDQSPSAGK